jgi:hypothetical protein
MSSYECLKKAEILLKKSLNGGSLDDIIQCSCSNGKMIVQIMATLSDDASEITCIICNGTGYIKSSKLLRNFIGCECKDLHNIIQSEDGYKIFGNETYLCGECGMVIQFG